MTVAKPPRPLADVLTMQLVNGVVDEVKATGRCDYRALLRKLGWSTHRFAMFDWGEVKQHAEILLGQSVGLPRVQIFGVQQIFFKWLDASPRTQEKMVREGQSPDHQPNIFCPVNATPDGVVEINQLTQAMIDYVAAVKNNHIEGRVVSAVRLADTAVVAQVPCTVITRKGLAGKLGGMIPPVPDVVRATKKLNKS